jgi:hypothetical protein
MFNIANAACNVISVKITPYIQELLEEATVLFSLISAHRTFINVMIGPIFPKKKS